MASTPAVVPTANNTRCPPDRSRPVSPPLSAQNAAMVAMTSTLLATGAKAAAANRRVEWSRAVATAPMA